MTDKEQDDAMLSVDDALKMYEEYKTHWNENYREAEIDLKMYIGDPSTHYGLGWDDKYTTPTGAMVVDNELPQYVHQVTNDIRQNTPSIKVLPEADGDLETAKIFSGLIRGIEYKSAADEAYDTAADYAVKCSIGFIKVDHDFCDEHTDLQELYIRSVPDPLTIFNDPSSMEWDGRDSNGQIALEPISKKEFNKLYPKFEFISFTDAKNKDEKDIIIIGNIYIREFTGKNRKKVVIHHYKFSGDALLAQTTFPGKYLPYTPVYGEMQWIDGKRILSSLIRQARSPQRRLNHMLSKESQVLAQAPIAPILAVEGTLVNERKQYQMPGLENALEYRQTDLDGNQAPAPIRLQPPSASNGFLEAIASAKEAIKASMGIYNAGLGKREGDVSGIALKQLDQSGDVATFHFPDNVRRSINQVGRTLVACIPEIYDTPRVLQIIDEETEPKNVGVNGGTPQQDQKHLYDLTKGSYHVRVTTGTSYTTKRNEAAKLYGDVIKSDPALMQVIGDLWAKNLDVAGADAMASRLRKMIPPNLLEEKDQAQIPPQVTQKMQEMEQVIQQASQQIQTLQAELQNKQGDQLATAKELEIKGGELAIKNKEADIKAGELKLKFMQSVQGESSSQETQDNNMNETPEALGMKIEQEIERLVQLKADAEQKRNDEMMAVQAKQDKENLDIQMKQTDMQQRAEQANALINMLGNISIQLNGINALVSREPVVVRGENGAVQGLTYKPTVQ